MATDSYLCACAFVSQVEAPLAVEAAADIRWRKCKIEVRVIKAPRDQSLTEYLLA